MRKGTLRFWPAFTEREGETGEGKLYPSELGLRRVGRPG